jgi:tellurite resistance protein TerC
MFIGVKLILTYLHETWTEIPKIPTVGSLAVIGLILFVSTVASFIKVRKDPAAQAHAGRMSSGKHTEGTHHD